MKKSQTRNRARRTLRRAREESRAAVAAAPAQPASAPPLQQEMHRLGVRGERQKGAMAKWASLLGRARPPKAAK